jgi:hypothetical protein
MVAEDNFIYRLIQQTHVSYIGLALVIIDVLLQSCGSGCYIPAIAFLYTLSLMLCMHI